MRVSRPGMAMQHDIPVRIRLEETATLILDQAVLQGPPKSLLLWSSVSAGRRVVSSGVFDTSSSHSRSGRRHSTIPQLPPLTQKKSRSFRFSVAPSCFRTPSAILALLPPTQPYNPAPRETDSRSAARHETTRFPVRRLQGRMKRNRPRFSLLRACTSSR